MKPDTNESQENQRPQPGASGGDESGPNPLVAAILGGALGALLGAAGGFLSIFLLIDGLVINGVRFSAGGQVLLGATAGFVLGATICSLAASAKSNSR